MAQMFQELQFAICSLGQDGCAERLHNFLDGDGRSGQLISCGTVNCPIVLIFRNRFDRV